MPHYHFNNHQHTTPEKKAFRNVATSTYGVIVGQVDTTTEKPITGRNGAHLQFYLVNDQGQRYQVDVNTQSRDGTTVLSYIAELPASGAPAGANTDAALSYRGMGLTNDSFAPVTDTRIDSLLKAALAQAESVAAYGFCFDDGGPNGKGVHDTHLNPGKPNQDGAVAVYLVGDNNEPVVRWFFFMFENETVQ